MVVFHRYSAAGLARESTGGPGELGELVFVERFLLDQPAGVARERVALLLEDTERALH